MPEMLNHVEYLSQQIGPRPAGTEEEQQAALYITEQFQKEAGLSAAIEDFNSPSNSELPRALCAVITAVAAILSLIFSVLLIPAIILTVASAVVAVAEMCGKPVISPFFARGVSQNVVAKYEPGYSPEATARRRKVIVVARYDSGKVRAELNGPALALMPALNAASFGGMVAVPVLLVFKALFLLNAVGVAAVVMTILTIAAAVCAALPGLLAVLHKLAAYNEAANANASGVSVLIDVACRVGRGRVSEADLAASEADAVVHGEEAARAAGLVPDGAQLAYDAPVSAPAEPAPQTQADRLTAAKAAIAAMTGQPVNMGTSLDLSEGQVRINAPEPLQSPEEAKAAQSDEACQAPELASAAASAPAQSAPVAVEAGATATAAMGMTASAAVQAAQLAAEAGSVKEKEVPAWFKKAQEKAKKPKSGKTPIVHRSRYADAFDAALPEDPEPVAPAQSAPAAQGDAQEHVAPASTEANATIRMEPVPSESTAAPLADDPAASLEQPTPPQQAAPAAVEGLAASQPEAPAHPSSRQSFQIPEVPSLESPELAFPSFLDPMKAQADALEQQSPRGENRVAVDFDPAAADFGAAPLANPGAAAVPAAAPEPLPAPMQPEQKKDQRITLPDVDPSLNLTPVEELQKQHAPLAEAAEGKRRALGKTLRSMLPSITGSITAEDLAAVQRGSLSPADIPSLSGAFSPVEPQPAAVVPAEQEEEQATQYMPPVSGSAGMTGAFAPVGTELMQGMDPEDMYVEDADDSVYEESFTETGAFAGPGYVEMPKSRVSRLFDRFRRKKDEPEVAASEWLGVDEEFDARSVGAARGGWESFLAEDAAEEAYAYEGDQYEEYYEESQGDGFVDVDYDSFDDADDQSFSSNTQWRWNGGAFSVTQEQAVRNARPGEVAASPEDLQQIYQFRNPDIDTEVWFVALGSELAGNAGMRAFLQEHEHDLRGAIVIELDSLGAGDLCLVEREGAYRKVKASSRMQRIAKKATQATGVKVGSTDILWADSSASYATAHGVQAMHLVGMSGAKPAFFAQGNDVLENVDANLLEERAEYVMALLRNI